MHGEEAATVRGRPLLCSVRLGIVVLLMLCNLCLYACRANISVAIIYMYPNNDKLEGQMLAAFYVGYTVSQVPGGFLAARFGAKRVLSVCVVGWTTVTLLTGIVGSSPAALFALRCLVGVCEGPNYPCQAQIIAAWIPYSERSTCWALVVAGESMGTMIALLLGPLIASSFGWRVIFYGSAALSAVWFLLFSTLAASTPTRHSRISSAERTHILASRPEPPPPSRPPWISFFRSVPFLALMGTHFCYNWTYYVCLSWTSKFFWQIFRVQPVELGLLSVLPSILALCIGPLAGMVADSLEQRAGLSPTRMRKLLNSAGMGGAAAILLALAAVLPPPGTSDPPPPVAPAATLLALVVGIGAIAGSAGCISWRGLETQDCKARLLSLCSLLSLSTPSYGTPLRADNANFVDLSPRHSQLLLGISNSIASLPGVAAGAMTGSLLAATHNDWALIYRISAGSMLTGALLFAFFAQAVDQHYGEPPPSAACATSSSLGRRQPGSLSAKLLDEAAPPVPQGVGAADADAPARAAAN